MPRVSRSCRSHLKTPPRPAPPYRKSPRPRGCKSWVGAASPPTTHRWARCPVMPCPPSGRCSWLARPAWRWSGAAMWSASGPSMNSAPRVRVKTGRAGKPYFPSLSGQTLVYKGMLTTPQLKAFYLDLQDERLTSALGIVHSRFSTNTFPSGRWRIHSGGSRTTGRSTPSPVTRTGCGPARR